jgi:hypothetical protein
MKENSNEYHSKTKSKFSITEIPVAIFLIWLHIEKTAFVKSQPYIDFTVLKTL